MSVAAAAAAAPAAGDAGAPGAEGAAAPAAGGWTLSSILRMLMLYWMVSSYFKGSTPSTAPVKDVVTGRMHQAHRNAWLPDTPYSLYTYVHDSPELDVSQFTAATLNPRSLIWFESGLKYGWDPATSERAFNWSMETNSWPMQHLYANGSLYAHVFFVKEHTPLFPWRGVDEVYGEDAYTHTAAALVVGSDGTAVAGSQDGGAGASSVVPALAPLPSPESPSFADRYVRNPGFVPSNIMHRVMVLNVFKPAPKIVDKKNLLGVSTGDAANASTELEVFTPPAGTEEIESPQLTAEEEEEELLTQQFLEEDDESTQSAVASSRSKQSSVAKKGKSPAGAVRGAPWLSYWKPFLSVRLIPDWTVFPHGGIPAELAEDYMVDPVSDAYDPPVYFDYFWLLQEQLVIVNRTVGSLGLNLTHSPLSLLKWRLETQMETSWKMQQSYGLQESDGRESEMIKRLILDTNIYLLALTFFVSILHSVFDFLAFKNDVKFWKDAKSMRGLSTRSILMNAVCQVIIFFYLLDNDTSYMILLSSGIGCIIEIWKVRKAVTLRIDRSRPFPHIRIMSKTESEDKAEEDKTSEEKELEQHAKYDEEAMKYLSYVLYPLLVCYAGYSLYYETHKSWYSFILAVLTGCVYTFGFIMMCPQLYINYKLKSVAHLPWRMLTYKALNTFIDDLFAFIIKMPTLHRLACFRDDLIFFVFLYQKWAYRVDFTRTNEFGAAFVSPEEKEKIEENDRKEREAIEARKQAAAGGSSNVAASDAEKKHVDAADEPADDISTQDESTLRQRTQASAVSEMD